MSHAPFPFSKRPRKEREVFEEIYKIALRKLKKRYPEEMKTDPQIFAALAGEAACYALWAMDNAVDRQQWLTTKMQAD